MQPVWGPPFAMKLGAAMMLAGALFSCRRAEDRARSPETVPLTILSTPDAATRRDAPTLSSCVIEGDGEPMDRLYFHKVDDFLLFAARSDASPVARLEGVARYNVHARWSEMWPEGDGRARVELERARVFRAAGFTQLGATRFQLRRRAAVVPDHVWLEANTLVRITEAVPAGFRVLAHARLRDELAVVVPCEDLSYDQPTEKMNVILPHDGDAHVEHIELYDAPGGRRVLFQADSVLFYVAVDGERDGFLHVSGRYWNLSFAGWTPQELVSHEGAGNGGPAGSGTSHQTKSGGTPGRTLRATPLIAERHGTATKIGEIAEGVDVKVLATPGDDATLVVAIPASDLVPVGDVTFRLAAADVERR